MLEARQHKVDDARVFAEHELCVGDNGQPVFGVRLFAKKQVEDHAGFGVLVLIGREERRPDYATIEVAEDWVGAGDPLAVVVEDGPVVIGESWTLFFFDLVGKPFVLEESFGEGGDVIEVDVPHANVIFCISSLWVTRKVGQLRSSMLS